MPIPISRYASVVAAILGAPGGGGTITVDPTPPTPVPLAISGMPVTIATQGQPYAGFQLTASGGQPPYIYSIKTGNLPAGLSLDALTGIVSGTPVASGTQAGIVLRVTDALGATADLAPFQIVVSSVGAALSISGVPTTNGIVGAAFTSFEVAAAGGQAPYIFSFPATALPPGLSANPVNGATISISGSLTTAGTTTGIIIRVTDALGAIANLPAFQIAANLPTFQYQAETNALAAVLASPTTRRKGTYDWGISTLKASGLWDKMIRGYKVAEADATYVDIKNPSVTMTLSGAAPTLVANNNISNPGTAIIGTKVFLNDLLSDSTIVYFPIASVASSSSLWGAIDSASVGWGAAPKSATSFYNGRFGGSVQSNFGVAADWNGVGAHAHVRRGTKAEAWKGPVLKESREVGAPTAPLTNREIYLGGLNNNGALVAAPTTSGISCWMAFAGALSADEIALVSQIQHQWYDEMVQGEYDEHPAGYQPQNITKEVWVVGAGGQAVAFAYELKRHGIDVGIIGDAYARDAGGVAAHGLGQTDLRNAASFGGLARGMMAQTQVYGSKGTTEFAFDPRNFGRTIRGMLDPRISYGQDIPIYWTNGIKTVTKTGTRIQSITTFDGRTFTATLEVHDASYGLELAQITPGVTTIVGREAAGTGAEALNGWRGTTTANMGGRHQLNGQDGVIRYIDPRIDVSQPVSPSNLLPGISGVMGVDTPAMGAADGRSQAFNYRLTLTRSAQYRIPWPSTPPEGYQRINYEPLDRLFVADPTLTFDKILLENFVANTTTTGSVYDENANGGWSTDWWGLVNGFYSLSLADRKARAKLIENRIRGWFYYLCYETNSHVPAAVRASALATGLSSLHYNKPAPGMKANWMPTFYEREGPRLVNDFGWNGNDMIMADGTTPRSIKTAAVAFYEFDSHGTSAWAWEYSPGLWCIWVEGNFADASAGGADFTAPVPLEALLPRQSECTNLSVSFGVAGTHVAVGSFRMEFSTIMAAQFLALCTVYRKANGLQNVQDALTNYAAIRTMALASNTGVTPLMLNEPAMILPQQN